MEVRKIVHIDGEKCNGCGLCVPACHEGAIEIVDGRARLVSDKYCDGLGDCIGECPKGAITIIEREAEEFDEKAVKEHLRQKQKDEPLACGCPGSMVRQLDDEKQDKAAKDSQQTAVNADDVKISIKSQLKQWPVQLTLVPPDAPYFDGAHLLITADCVPVAYPNYHLDMLKGKRVVMGCPKLDDINHYISKLTQIIKLNDIKSVTVAYMEVPCCMSIVKAAEYAVEKSWKDIPFHRIKVGIEGGVLEKD